MPDSSKYKSELSLADLCDLVKKEIMLELNCHAMAVIQKFDATKQTVTAKAIYKKEYGQGDGTILVDYPLLVDVPVMVLSGGAASLRFPIAVGDSCVILFNDRDIDLYVCTGQQGAAPDTARLHSWADGIAIVGLHPASAPLQNYATDRAEFTNGPVQVSLGSTKMRLKNDAQSLAPLIQNLITKLESLCSKIQNITVASGSLVAPNGPVTGVSGTPVNASDFASISSDLSTIANNFAGLLE